MQLAQLLRRDLRRRAHHQILGALIHREQHHLAQVLLAGKKHDDAVDAGRDAAVGRRAKRERMQHAAEFLLQRLLWIAGDRERLLHHLGPVVTDGAGREFRPVADDVVLDRLDGEDLVAIGGIERQELLDTQVRHGERVVGEVDLLLLLVPLVHREVDDPAQLESVLVDQPQLRADPGARGTGELGGPGGLVGSEEDDVPGLRSGLGRDPRLDLGGDELGDRPLAAVRLEYDVAQAARAHVLARPVVELVEP